MIFLLFVGDLVALTGVFFEVCGTKIHSGDVFSRKGGPFPCTILFFGIFRIFKSLFELDRGLFELDLLLLLARNLQEELCVIIAIIRDMYVEIVGSCRIKIKDFNMFITRNHLSLHLLLSLHSPSHVKSTHVFFHLPLYGSLTLEPLTT